MQWTIGFGWSSFKQADAHWRHAAAQSLQARRHSISFRLNIFFPLSLPKMRRLNLPENKDGRPCVSAQSLGAAKSVPHATEIGWYVLRTDDG